ncbi:hypothetical protein [Candidatus Contubernalis alkaliaceticus]|uniref:hypothetical protein n=1 Tax=Candidatus Contubernalis alkaliaceticus TaxID=338645 RepID=UPI001F4C05D2|nr:hypothetical protein [Candidatus Contubernalis alkalaceticus]UNC92485.1 hypothetical protein HUE98_10480 [Candidatus Contubernalis alkalaceticus]
MSFERWFARVTEKFEFYLFRAALSLLVLLIVTQVVMSNENVRSFLSLVDQREGIPLEDYEEDQPVVSPSNTIGSDVEYFMLLAAEAESEASLEDLKVIINNEKEYSFQDNQVEIKVYSGDVIEIDGSSYSFPVRVMVSDASEDLTSTLSQAFVITYGTIELLGWVITE